MKRKEFLKSSLLIGSTTIFSSNEILTQNLVQNDIDKLVDKDGNYFQQPLPYSETFLEPYMDAETLHLHYTFHPLSC